MPQQYPPPTDEMLAMMRDVYAAGGRGTTVIRALRFSFPELTQPQAMSYSARYHGEQVTARQQIEGARAGEGPPINLVEPGGLWVNLRMRGRNGDEFVTQVLIKLRGGETPSEVLKRIEEVIDVIAAVGNYTNIRLET